MKYDQLMNLIETRGDFDSRQHAEQATKVTLQVLAQRLSGGEPGDLLAQLPAELKGLVPQAGGGETFDAAEFARRVADGEGRGCSADQALAHAHAVLRTVAETVSDREIEDLQAQLPKDLEPLLR